MPWRRPDPIPWNTLRVRLTLWNTAVVFLMTVTALAAVRLFSRKALEREADAVLRGECHEIAMALGTEVPDLEAVVMELQRKAVSHDDRGWFTQLLGEDGQTVWRSARCPDEVADLPATSGDPDENVVQVGRFRYVRQRIPALDREPYHVRIGMSTESIDSSVAILMSLLIPTGGILSLLTPLVGYWLAVRATKPVADILQTAEGLRPTRLGERLPVAGTRDELDQLSSTINRLLDQVAEHVDRQEQFVADAAHELRSPLAATQSTLEVAISQDRPAAEYRETLGEVLEETRHLSRLANDLLMLAEIGSQDQGVVTEPVDLATIAQQSAAMFAGVAEEQGLDITVVGGDLPAIHSSAAAIRQVLGNLLDNAIRFTPSGGRITVRLAADAPAGCVEFHVADTGPGIPPEHLRRVFDRFYKADSARSRLAASRSGGLGLAICKAIVERLGGSIAIASPPGQGTTVTVRLPIAAAASAESTKIRQNI